MKDFLLSDEFFGYFRNMSVSFHQMVPSSYQYDSDASRRYCHSPDELQMFVNKSTNTIDHFTTYFNNKVLFGFSILIH